MDVSVTHFGAGGQTPPQGATSVGLHRSLTPSQPSRAAKIARLSAGVVPGGVSFDPHPHPHPSHPPAKGAPSNPMALHAAPADRNTAATGVALGRVIDVTA